MRKDYLSVVLWFLFPVLLLGEGDFRHLTIGEGLSSNRTYQAVQDSTGFVWITTDEGVDRYDGRHVVHYVLERYEISAGMGYQFNRIFLDGDDNVYLLTNRCYAYRLDRHANRFEPIKAFEKFYGRYVFSAVVDSSGNILVGTPGGMLAYDVQTERVEMLSHALVLNDIHALISFGRGYLLGRGKGLFLLSADLTQLDTLGSYPFPDDLAVNCSDLYYDRHRDCIWMATKNAGLLRFDLSDSSWHEAGSNDPLQEFPIWDIEPQGDETLLLGTDGAGLFRYDPERQQVTGRYTYDPDQEGTLSSNVIHGILRTREGLFFITTDIGGVNILNPGKLAFFSLRREKGNPNSLRNNVIHAIDEVAPGVIAFGTDMGVSLWYPREQRWRHLENTGRTGKNNVVTAITHAADGTFWVAYFIRRMKVYHASSRYRKVPPELALCKNSKALYFDDERTTLWSSRSNRRVKLVSYNFTTHTTARFTLPQVTALAGWKGEVLAGTTEGMYLVNTKTGDFVRFDHLQPRQQRITALAVIQDGVLWAGSERGGVIRMIPPGDSVTVFDTRQGMASDHILSLEVDGSGCVWALTDAGLSRIDPRTREVINYFASDGITSDDFKYSASCSTSDGRIIIGGTNGATWFDPATIGRPVITSRLVFTDLYVNQKRISGGDHFLLQEMIDRAKIIRLDHKQNSFSVHFTNIDLVHPRQTLFSWKLEGLETEWSPPAATGKAVYTNVPPGEYLFRVRLVSPLLTGKKTPERMLRIHISPPFWKTPLAFVLYVVLILFIVLLALYYNKLMHDVRSTREKLRYIANMAHEIKTPLSLIRAPIGDLIRQTDDEKVSEKLTLAMNNIERLQKKIRQFLDFKRIEKPGAVHPEKIDLVAFVRKKIFAFELVAARNDVKIHFETLSQELSIYCDPDLLDRILSNLLSNAVKYNKPGGFVNVRLQQEEQHWILTVTDSGIGIPAKDRKKIFRPFFRAGNAVGRGIAGSGVGLALVWDMVTALHGSIRFKSREDKGTTFILRVPVGQPDLYDEVYKQCPEREEEERQDASVSPEDSFSILIVEDDDELRDYMKKEMSRHYKVTTARNGQEALERVRKELPDLVLADVAMPRMNGRQLCVSIKSQPATSHIPVILLSALDSKEHILKGLEAGADDYVTKPFDSSILIAKIENLIGNRKKLREKLLNPETGYTDADIKSDFDREFVKSITRILEENLSDSDLSVRMLYTQVGMSRTAFYHKLRSLIGISPAEFIRTIRLNKARELLRTGRYNVSEVAYMCGFSDAKYFSTAFKKQFGNSPSACLGKR